MGAPPGNGELVLHTMVSPKYRPFWDNLKASAERHAGPDLKLEFTIPSDNSGSMALIQLPNGTGKTTLVKRALSTISNIQFSVSATTRSMRVGEKDGVDYHFLSMEAFNALKNSGLNETPKI